MSASVIRTWPLSSALVQGEWLKLVRRRASSWLALGIVAIVVFCYWSVADAHMDTVAALAARLDVPRSVMAQRVAAGEVGASFPSELAVLHPRMAAAYSLGALNILGPLLAPLLGALSVGSEYRYRTIAVLWTHGRPRWTIVGSRFAALALWLLGACLLASVTGVLCSVAVHGLYDVPWIAAPGDTSSAGERLVGLARQVVVTVTVLLLWASFGALVAELTRSTLAGAAAGFGYPYLEELLLVRFDALRELLPVWNQNIVVPSVFAEVTGRGAYDYARSPGGLAPDAAFAVLVIFTLACVAISCLVATRQEVS